MLNQLHGSEAQALSGRAPTVFAISQLALLMQVKELETASGTSRPRFASLD
jgi:hypothetical protein